MAQGPHPVKTTSDPTRVAYDPMPRHWTAFLIAVCLALVFVAGVQAVRCWDIFYHLRLGKYALREGLLRVEVFSQTARGRPYLQCQWLAHILLYLGYVLGGINLLIVAKAAVIALAHAFLLLACFNRTGRAGAASYLAVLVSASALMTRSFVRGEMFSFLLFGITCWAVEAIRLARPRRLWWLLPIFAVWSNVHGAFVGALALLGLEIGGLTIEHWLSERRRSGRWKFLDLPRPLRVAWIVLPLCFLATLCNPFTWRTWRVPFWLFLNPEVKQFIGEWHPPRFGVGFPPSAIPLVALLCVTIIALVWQAIRGRRVRVPDVLRLGAFGYLAFRAERQIPVFGLVCAPVFAAALDRPLKRMCRVLPKRADSYRGLATFLSMAFLFWLGVWPTLSRLGGFGFSRYPGYPFKTAEWLNRHEVRGPVFCEWTYGTFFLWTLDWRANPLCIDGRAEVYGSDLIRQFRLARAARPGWSEKLAAWNVEIVALDITATGVRQLLPELLHASPDWALAYWDETSLVYLRRSAANAPVIAQVGEYRYRPDRKDLFQNVTPDQTAAIAKELYRKLERDPDCYAARMLIAEYHERRGEPETAARQYEAIVRQRPYIGAAWLGLARAFLRMKEYDRAEQAAQNALERHASKGEALRILGNVYHVRGRFKEAVRAYREAARAAPGDWRIYLDLAVTYDSESDVDRTRQALREVLKRNPDCEVARRRLRQLERAGD